MKKQAISKRIISVALALFMLSAFVPTVAVNAASVPRMQSSLETSVYIELLSFPNMSAEGAYVLHDNGELWAYIAGSPTDPTRLLSSQVMTNVIAVTFSPAIGDSLFFGVEELYSPSLVALALRSDGTVWLTAVGVRRANHEIYIRTTQLDSGVAKISGNHFLKENGDLYSVGRFRLDNTERTLEFPGIHFHLHLNRVSSNVLDIAGHLYIPSNRILEVGSARIENVQAVFAGSIANFALTANGRLYGWGNNTTGSVGVGPVLDRASGVSGNWRLLVQTPRHVVFADGSSIASVYFDGNIVFARDTSGRLWQWGDAEPAIVSNSRVETWGAAERLRPRLSTHAQPTLNSINGVTILSDGSLVVQSFNIRNVAQDITLPIRLADIMGSGGTPAPTQPTTPQQPTIDIPSSWAIPQVNAAISAGLVPQNLQSRYTQATTRAEFAALAVALYETATGREITGRAQFNDTNDINIQKMGYLSVVTGVGGGNFAPNNTLTREQAAVMLARLANAIGQPLPQSAPTFADNNQISSWAIDSVGQIQAVGIMGGVGNNQFDPLGHFTIEQSIITMLRLFELFD